MSVEILIIDDSETDRYLLSRMVRRAGLADSVTEARSAEEGLEIVRARAAGEAPLLLMLDINMPRTSGFELLQILADEGRCSSAQALAVIVMSSSTRDEDMQRARSFPCVVGYLDKDTMNAEDLAEMVGRMAPGASSEG